MEEAELAYLVSFNQPFSERAWAAGLTTAMDTADAARDAWRLVVDAKLPPPETVGADVQADIERIEDNHRLPDGVQTRMLEPLHEELDAEQRCDAAMRKAVRGDKCDELRWLQKEAHCERWQAFYAWHDAQSELETRERMISSAANRQREGWAPPSPCQSDDAHTCWLVGCDQCSMCYHCAPGEA